MLLEALVALIVVALGLFGILALQARTLADTQTGVRQAQAIRLIENLSERIRLNPNSMSSAVADSYVSDWGNVTGTIPNNCNSGCTAANLAKFEIDQWKRTVTSILPNADSKIFYVNDEKDVPSGNRRQLGVMVSWRENEIDQSTQTDAEKANYLKYFNLSSKDSSGADVKCQSNRTCYLQFIQLAARCYANANAGASALKYFCADGGVLDLPANLPTTTP
jgi:type IV pilus assembly protein PilV